LIWAVTTPRRLSSAKKEDGEEREEQIKKPGREEKNRRVKKKGKALPPYLKPMKNGTDHL
jgi:hypothetical protein